MARRMFIGLLRGINVGGRNRLPMAELRVLCAELGWGGIATYIQSGNVVFQADGAPAELAAELEAALERRFGLAIPVIVRTAADWPALVASNPYPDAARSQPNRVMLGLSRAPPHPGALDALRERAADGELVARAGDALWFHFGSGVGRSRLTPALLDRVAGSPVTLRNWRTVLELAELAAPETGGHPPAGGP